MRCQIRESCALFVSMLLLIIPFHVFAGWEVLKPERAIPREPFFQTGIKLYPRRYVIPSSYSAAAFPAQYATLGQPMAIYAVSISGSLKENLERIMGRYHWRVIWKSPNDYNFDGRVTGSSLPNVVEKLLKPFPLQAVMYMSNRTVAIVPRSNY